MPKLLDLFCGAGGAAQGYAWAGFGHIVGIDIAPQPRYSLMNIKDAFVVFYQEDAIEFLRKEISNPWFKQFDAIHASPPCQRYSNAQRIRDNEHPDLIPPLRELLKATGLPYVIENVVGAPLVDPITLCGESFGLGVYRHRLFESNIPLVGKPCHHDRAVTKMGRPVRDGEMMHVVGHFAGVAKAREAMGIPWMTRDELRESIPPAYTEWIGTQLMERLKPGTIATCNHPDEHCACGAIA